MNELSRAWVRLPIARIEDLSDGVYGAGLDVTQMSRLPLSGSLVFSQQDDILYSSGLINGQIALRGPLSRDLLTVGVGLRMGAGTRHWLNETVSGAVGVFHAGDEHDAFYTPGSLYATASLSIERLEEIAADEELVLDRPVLGGTGLYHRPMPAAINMRLKQAFERIHAGHSVPRFGEGNVGNALLDAIVDLVGREPMGLNRRSSAQAHARIVERARAYIAANLAQPISPNEIARAANTSRRTLFRAFADLLDDTPQGYVRRLRLHRIRHDLADREEAACTIALIANRWGISELGRMAGWYNELFGERPSATLALALRGAPKTSSTRH
ncbi:helix-turn-helix domain-containing protein [Ensifer adhaerens]|uniref:helix-turn-helix domain-containing protein n=1 Tax=Ensifer adhaerens TaxID=106592 RepID=UPI0023A9A882|nr:helix-turn-helix domain-containing protein [Ensifer adhaerens]WDZ78807.1 helix-turn-helix domain-containing protein [Ensifer adhaerens]